MQPRKFARVSNRVESGAIQFGEDHPGLFLRGDDANYLSCAIEVVLKHLNENDLNTKMCVMVLKDVKQTIDDEVVQSPHSLVAKQ